MRIRGFDPLQPGRALGVIGPGGSGKSLLARVLVGAVTLAGGTLRLGDPPLARLKPRARSAICRNAFTLLPGTLGREYRSRVMIPAADPAVIVAAARLAGVHAVIAALPDGYAMNDPAAAPWRVGWCSGIGLARAVFGDPRCW